MRKNYRGDVSLEIKKSNCPETTCNFCFWKIPENVIITEFNKLYLCDKCFHELGVSIYREELIQEDILNR